MQLRIISCEILEHYLRQDNILLIDLRSRESYEREHIEHAVWKDWETLEDSIASYLSTLSFSPVWIILYCEHGNTSLLIARDLARNGYPVISLVGGYSSWKKYKKNHHTA